MRYSQSYTHSFGAGIMKTNFQFTNLKKKYYNKPISLEKLIKIKEEIGELENRKFVDLVNKSKVKIAKISSLITSFYRRASKLTRLNDCLKVPS